MCTIIFAYKMHPKYDLIYLGNRDEYKYRKTESSRFIGNVLMGVDLEKGGTWLGLNLSGKLSFVTNYRDFSLVKELSSSRGDIVRSYLQSDVSSKEYIEILDGTKDKYNPYNIVIGDMDELLYFSSVDGRVEVLKSGIYGLSNGFINDPWHKVEKAKKRLLDMLYDEFIEPEGLFKILSDREIPDDALLPDTKVPLELERALAPIHVDYGDYGTVFKTVILIDKDGNAEYYEKNYRDGFAKTNKIEFQIVK